MALTLEKIDAAIDAVLESGQTVTVDGMTFSKANLNALWSLRRQVAGDASRSGGNRPVFRSFNLSGAAQ
jgi:hypothetical protein